MTWCLVTFYAISSAISAKREIDQKEFNGKKIIIKFSKKYKSEKQLTDTTLPINKCVDLANHYFGFNGKKKGYQKIFLEILKLIFLGWSTKIISFAQENLTKIVDGNTEKWSCTFKAIVRIELKMGKEKKMVDGVSSVLREAEDIVSCYHFVKKTAISDAIKNAFSMMVIVSLANKKIAVHLLDQDPEIWTKDEN